MDSTLIQRKLEPCLDHHHSLLLLAHVNVESTKILTLSAKRYIRKKESLVCQTAYKKRETRDMRFGEEILSTAVIFGRNRHSSTAVFEREEKLFHPGSGSSAK